MLHAGAAIKLKTGSSVTFCDLTAEMKRGRNYLNISFISRESKTLFTRSREDFNKVTRATGSCCCCENKPRALQSAGEPRRSVSSADTRTRKVLQGKTGSVSTITELQVDWTGNTCAA